METPPLAPGASIDTPVDTTQLKPVAAIQRISSVDIIRGVALLGILLMNVVGMGLHGAYSDPTNSGGAEGWNLFVFKMNTLFFEGTMRGLFSVLFGAGVILFTTKKEASGIGLPIADAWYRRTIWLIVFGMIHAYILLWPGDILYSYGLMGLLLFTFRKAVPGQLIKAAIVLILAGTIWTAYEYNDIVELEANAQAAMELRDDGAELNREQSKALERWEDVIDDFKPSDEDKQEHIDNMHAGYFSAMKELAPHSFKSESYFSYRYDIFDILSMMLLGMALLKAGVLSAAKSTRFYVIMMLVGYGIGIPVNLYEFNSFVGSGYDIVTLHRTWLTYDLGRVATMFGHIGLVMLFCKSGVLGFLQRSLTAVGRMALTNYIMHTVITTFVFVILGQYALWERYQLYFLVLGIWIFQLIVSPLWLKYYRFGPLEWVWRWLTYRKRPVLRKNE